MATTTKRKRSKDSTEIDFNKRYYADDDIVTESKTKLKTELKTELKTNNDKPLDTSRVVDLTDLLKDFDLYENAEAELKGQVLIKSQYIIKFNPSISYIDKHLYFFKYHYTTNYPLTRHLVEVDFTRDVLPYVKTILEMNQEYQSTIKPNIKAAILDYESKFYNNISLLTGLDNEYDKWQTKSINITASNPERIIAGVIAKSLDLESDELKDDVNSDVDIDEDIKYVNKGEVKSDILLTYLINTAPKLLDKLYNIIGTFLEKYNLKIRKVNVENDQVKVKSETLIKIWLLSNHIGSPFVITEKDYATTSLLNSYINQVSEGLIPWTANHKNILHPYGIEDETYRWNGGAGFAVLYIDNDGHTKVIKNWLYIDYNLLDNIAKSLGYYSKRLGLHLHDARLLKLPGVSQEDKAKVEAKIKTRNLIYSFLISNDCSIDKIRLMCGGTIKLKIPVDSPAWRGDSQATGIEMWFEDDKENILCGGSTVDKRIAEMLQHEDDQESNTSLEQYWIAKTRGEGSYGKNWSMFLPWPRLRLTQELLKYYYISYQFLPHKVLTLDMSTNHCQMSIAEPRSELERKHMLSPWFMFEHGMYHFSLGTPAIPFDNVKSEYIAVGHSRFDDFNDDHVLLKKIFENHPGYIDYTNMGSFYFMFFYTFDKISFNIKRLSPSFLATGHYPYVIQFACGITRMADFNDVKNLNYDRFIVSYGEGDIRSKLLFLKYSEINKLLQPLEEIATSPQRYPFIDFGLH